jgi:L-malate glycosyltransferase
MAQIKIPVLHIIKSLGRGGAEVLLPETLKFHDKEKFEFHYLYFLPWKDQMVSALKQNGGIVHCFASNNNLALMLKAVQVSEYVKKNNIQLIHAHLPWAGILARLVGKKTGVPIIYTEHNKQERYHFATRFMNLITLNLLTKIIAVSADVMQSIKKHKPALKADALTILNGVDTSFFSPDYKPETDVRVQFKIPSDAPVIGTIAVFRFQKRLDLWLSLAKQIRIKQPNVHFIIVGDGPLRTEIHQKANELGLEDVVHFSGLQTEVRPYLAAFDLYMMTSVFEGLPIAMLEAMSSACPVISTDAGGIKEVIRNNENGLLCGVDEPGRLVDFAVSLLNDLPRRKQIGLQGRKRITEKFSMEKMVKELEQVYFEVYSQKKV